MLSSPLIPALCLAILCVLVIRTAWVMRYERKNPVRGSEPGTGYHMIHSDYSSGLSGHQTSYKIPRDADAYAKIFVPRQSKDKS